VTGAASLLVATLLAQSPPAFTAGVTNRAERVTYHFTNDSSFDSAGLVPHFFEQRYTSGRTSITLAARYPFLGRRASTTISFSPRVSTAGSDIDTFFQPNGDVATSGSDGIVSLGSWAVRQEVPIARARSWEMSLAIGYRRSRADFPPDDRIVTHTQPASVTRTFTTDRETTFSHVIDVGLNAATTRPVSAHWMITGVVALAPVTRARLVTELPDKYPGQDIVFEALAFGCTGSLSIVRAWTHLGAGLGVDAGVARGYHRAADYRQHAMSVTLFLQTSR
jgi:hypothetical protein